MNVSDKQENWSNDIKVRIDILRNAFLVKCKNLDDAEVKKALNKVEQILSNANQIYIIDEYKSLTDESLVKIFEMSDKKFCKLFIMMFTTKDAIYEVLQKQRLENQKKLQQITSKYSKLKV